MRIITATLAMVLAASEANTAPIKLVCDVKVTRGADPDRAIKETLTLTIDYRAKTVMLNTGFPTSTPIDRMDEDAIWFEPKDHDWMTDQNFIGVMYGKIDRFSGALFMRYRHSTGGTFTDGIYLYEGICKPAQKLF
jgi:hypothetical protein